MTPVIAAGSLGLVLLFLGLTSSSRPAASSRRNLFGMRTSTYGWMMAWFLAGSSLGFLATTSSVLAALLGGLAATLPPARVRRAEMRRLRDFQEAWPQALASLIAYLRSGASLGDALVELAMRGPDVLRGPLQRFASGYRSTGNLVGSIAMLREAARDPIADRVCAALDVAYEAGGGDLVRVLTSMSSAIRDDLRTRREVEARWSWTITAARVAAAAPWMVLVLMVTKVEARSAYASPEGAAVIVVGAIATCIGYGLMSRVARLPLAGRAER
jgi:tight adherence protein B